MRTADHHSFKGLDCLIISNPPKQKVVGAVVPPNRFAAVGQPEVLVAVSTRNNKMVGFGRDVGGGSAVRGVPTLQVPIDRAAALRLITWSQEQTGLKFKQQNHMDRSVECDSVNLL